MKELKLTIAVIGILLSQSCNQAQRNATGISLSLTAVAETEKLTKEQMDSIFNYEPKHYPKFIDNKGAEAKSINLEGVTFASSIQNGVTIIKKDKYLYFVDETGTNITGKTYRQATIYSDGLACVIGNHGYPEYINEKGDVVFELKDARFASAFKNGFAWFNANEKFGFINSKGEIIAKPQFNNCNSFSENLAPVSDSNNKWGAIDEKGNIVIQPEYQFLGAFAEGLALFKTQGSNLFGFIDKSGKITIEPQFANVMQFSDGLAPVKREEFAKWGFIDKSGKLAINPQFQRVSVFVNGLAAFQDDRGYWGYIDKTGKIIIEPQFTEAADFIDSDFAWANLSEDFCQCSWGKIDRKGSWVIQPVFANVYDGRQLYKIFDSYTYMPWRSVTYYQSDAERFREDLGPGTGKWYATVHPAFYYMRQWKPQASLTKAIEESLTTVSLSYYIADYWYYTFLRRPNIYSVAAE